MKKIIFTLLAIAFISSVCFCMGGPPPSAFTGQETKVLTGEVDSMDLLIRGCIRVVWIDDSKAKTTIDLQQGTSEKLFIPSKDKKYEIKYFVVADGRNVALYAHEINK